MPICMYVCMYVRRRVEVGTWSWIFRSEPTRERRMILRANPAPPVSARRAAFTFAKLPSPIVRPIRYGPTRIASPPSISPRASADQCPRDTYVRPPFTGLLPTRVYASERRGGRVDFAIRDERRCGGMCVGACREGWGSSECYL